jgi:hypothetical protein
VRLLGQFGGCEQAFVHIRQLFGFCGMYRSYGEEASAIGFECFLPMCVW